MLRIVPYTVPRVGRSHEHFSDGFELRLVSILLCTVVQSLECRVQGLGFMVYDSCVHCARKHHDVHEPYTLTHSLHALHPKSAPSALHPKPSTLNPKSYTSNPKRFTLNPEYGTLDSKL